MGNQLGGKWRDERPQGCKCPTAHRDNESCPIHGVPRTKKKKVKNVVNTALKAHRLLNEVAAILADGREYGDADTITSQLFELFEKENIKLPKPGAIEGEKG